MIEALIRWTAWEMIPPKAYSPFHILFFLIGIILSLWIAYRLRNSDERQNRIVLLTVSGLLIVSEVYKQLFYYYVIGNHSYQWWIFPFQLCSVPMYLCLIAPLLPTGSKLQKSMYDFMLAFNLMSGFLAFLEPSGLTHAYWTLTLHAFTWHMMLVFIGLYLGMSKRAARSIEGFINALKLLMLLSLVAFSINVALWDISANTVNMFFLGPQISPIIVFKSIALKFGWYVNLPVYLVCLSVGGFLFYYPFVRWNEKAAVPDYSRRTYFF